jgi:iron complex transport system permease protein
MKKLKKRYFILIFLCFVLIASFLVSVSLGSVMVPFGNTFKILFMSKTGFIGQDEVGVQRDIILKIRVPRVFLGMIVGAALSVSGLIFQALLKNPLAAPHTLGVTAGASFGAAIAIFLSYVIHANVKTFLPLFAFLGGLSTVFLVYMLAKTKGRVQVLTMILAGVVVSYLFSSGLVLIMSLMGDRSHEIIYWLMGSLAGYKRYLR